MSAHSSRSKLQQAFIAWAVVLAMMSSAVVPARAKETAPPVDADTAKLVAELGLIEADKPIREMQGWKRPRKVVVLSPAPMLADQLERYREVAPGVQVVQAKDSAEALIAVKDADALIGACNPEVVAAGRQLKWIHTFFAGVEGCVKIPAIRERGIVLTNSQRIMGPVMAEHTIALMLALSRGLAAFIPAQKNGAWREDNFDFSKLRVTSGKTILIAGLGGIGTEIAKRAHALGMKVIATRASGRDKPEFVSYVGTPSELDTLLKQADVVVNSTPLTEQTRGLFNARTFALMKPTAYFINVGRGASVVTDDLVAALNKGVISGAGLDVTDPEPLPPEHPLWRAANTIITPHIAPYSDLGLVANFQVGRENLRRYAAGEKMLSVVDTARGY